MRNQRQVGKTFSCEISRFLLLSVCLGCLFRMLQISHFTATASIVSNMTDDLFALKYYTLDIVKLGRNTSLLEDSSLGKVVHDLCSCSWSYLVEDNGQGFITLCIFRPSLPARIFFEIAVWSVHTCSREKYPVSEQIQTTGFQVSAGNLLFEICWNYILTGVFSYAILQMFRVTTLVSVEPKVQYVLHSWISSCATSEIFQNTFYRKNRHKNLLESGTCPSPRFAFDTALLSLSALLMSSSSWLCSRSSAMTSSDSECANIHESSEHEENGTKNK